MTCCKCSSWRGGTGFLCTFWLLAVQEIGSNSRDRQCSSEQDHQIVHAMEGGRGRGSLLRLSFIHGFLTLINEGSHAGHTQQESCQPLPSIAASSVNFRAVLGNYNLFHAAMLFVLCDRASFA